MTQSQAILVAPSSIAMPITVAPSFTMPTPVTPIYVMLSYVNPSIDIIEASSQFKYKNVMFFFLIFTKYVNFWI